jgi:hypothetical protein
MDHGHYLKIKKNILSHSNDCCYFNLLSSRVLDLFYHHWRYFFNHMAYQKLALIIVFYKKSTFFRLYFQFTPKITIIMIREIVVVLTISSVALCSPAIFNRESRIVGGEDVTVAGQIPWTVSLRTLAGTHFCTGAIVNNWWIITAGLSFC